MKVRKEEKEDKKGRSTKGNEGKDDGRQDKSGGSGRGRETGDSKKYNRPKERSLDRTEDWTQTNKERGGRGAKEDKSGSEENAKEVRARKEQKRKRDGGRNDREDKDRKKAGKEREVREREEEKKKEKEETLKELREVCVTMWTSHKRYHCAADTPEGERIDPIEMCRGKYRASEKAPLTERCDSCARTLEAAKRSCSTVVATNLKKGKWRCKGCEDAENKKIERKSKGSRERRKSEETKAREREEVRKETPSIEERTGGKRQK